MEDPVDMDKVDAEFRDILQKMLDNKNKEKATRRARQCARESVLGERG